MKVLALLLALILSILACLPDRNSLPKGPLEFTTIFEGQHSLADTSSTYLINNSEHWAKIWQFANGKIEPMPVLPVIDFNKYAIIAVFMGQKSSAGHRVEISEIVQYPKLSVSDGYLSVKAINYKRTGGMMLPVLTSPCHIVKIMKSQPKLSVTYIEVTEQ
ncbi:MAG: hypothetical protein GY839_14490 [candidate division Zixibacteria bacterium]|nr:hypothetical protein [candidate division Zixibacteria bacterium]